MSFCIGLTVKKKYYAIEIPGENNKLQKKLQLNGNAYVMVHKIHRLIDGCQAMQYFCLVMPRNRQWLWSKAFCLGFFQVAKAEHGQGLTLAVSPHSANGTGRIGVVLYLAAQ